MINEGEERRLNRNRRSRVTMIGKEVHQISAGDFGKECRRSENGFRNSFENQVDFTKDFLEPEESEVTGKRGSWSS